MSKSPNLWASKIESEFNDDEHEINFEFENVEEHFLVGRKEIGNFEFDDMSHVCRLDGRVVLLHHLMLQADLVGVESIPCRSPRRRACPCAAWDWSCCCRGCEERSEGSIRSPRRRWRCRSQQVWTQQALSYPSTCLLSSKHLENLIITINTLIQVYLKEPGR